MIPDHDRFVIRSFLTVESRKEIREIPHLFDTMVHTSPALRFGRPEKPKPASHLTPERGIADNMDHPALRVSVHIIDISAYGYGGSVQFESCSIQKLKGVMKMDSVFLQMAV